jgi:hypothetical protein
MWAEFVEAGLLRSYRSEHEVPLKELREFIDRLRDEFQVPYPLADRRPYVGSGRRLLIDLQDRSHLDPEFCLVAIANGQTVLTAPGEEFFERVDWSGDQPAGWRPHEDPASPIRINPLVRFGMPAVGGISTEALDSSVKAGALPSPAPRGRGRPSRYQRMAPSRLLGYALGSPLLAIVRRLVAVAAAFHRAPAARAWS